MATVADCRLMSTGQSSDDTLTLYMAVPVRRPVADPRYNPPGAKIARWVVVATFVGVGSSEPRCVDYRVRVVPAIDLWDRPTTEHDTQVQYRRSADEIAQQLAAVAITPAEAAQLGEIPAEGIPRYVFEEASQARLLATAREKALGRFPNWYGFSEDARVFLAQQSRPKRRGRPPVRSLGEKLRILADVERLPTLQAAADAHAMSRSAVRDLVSWARHDADPPLFTAYGPGRRGGELTEHARALLAQIEQESS